MSQAKVPREWWIAQNGLDDFIITHPPDISNGHQDAWTNVIEKSAYDALEKQLSVTQMQLMERTSEVAELRDKLEQAGLTAGENYNDMLKAQSRLAECEAESQQWKQAWSIELGGHHATQKYVEELKENLAAIKAERDKMYDLLTGDKQSTIQERDALKAQLSCAMENLRDTRAEVGRLQRQVAITMTPQTTLERFVALEADLDRWREMANKLALLASKCGCVECKAALAEYAAWRRGKL